MTQAKLNKMKLMPNLSFERYMKAVDKVLIAVCGLDHQDLADCAWYDSYETYKESGCTGLDVIEIASEYNEEILNLI